MATRLAGAAGKQPQVHEPPLQQEPSPAGSLPGSSLFELVPPEQCSMPCADASVSASEFIARAHVIGPPAALTTSARTAAKSLDLRPDN